MRIDKLPQRILENTSTAILVFNHALELIYINLSGEILFAASARQLQGRTVTELLPMAEKITKAITDSLMTGQIFTKRAAQLQIAYNQTITVDFTITPMLESTDEITHENEVLIEIKHEDRHLHIAREEQILAQYQTTRTLVRGMAHEIKNPLGGLRGAAQLLEQELNDDSLKDYTQIIIGEADRLQSLLNKMLGPNTLPDKRLINIHEVLERVRALVLAEIPEGIHFSCDYDPSIPEFNADMDQLIQAVLNIVRNATQALKGHGHITLRTRTQRQITIGPYRHSLVARIDIIDDGPGIPEDMIENIFYPMVTGRADGTGLGLSIAQSLVNQHGGLIECSSKPQQTTFTLLFPIGTHHDNT